MGRKKNIIFYTWNRVRIIIVEHNLHVDFFFWCY